MAHSAGHRLTVSRVQAKARRVPLTGATVEAADKAGKPWAFCLTTGSAYAEVIADISQRHLFLAAASAEERDAWILQLHNAGVLATASQEELAAAAAAAVTSEESAAVRGLDVCVVRACARALT
jgi:hypothetical protein